ncbi:UDP-4-amino-4,6-dideoxy-N-acetyl-beta-L-altrosamine transaminase [Hymenobacter busanensis]|uniref:UDP-4-amino-4, 6-dideoxy-N-acetyl-beta-L-altrosamine transaminase n=1 Tax=Hymenobacter busanensis TaxID=2607656 RepID=A0A7L4ZVC3_9BACT|nr:UDP-4-amino-4,6-dideoxy-N-acetyl-beta-L-altrosamine transaminase [Hymenobacter busanensis]KAA9339466.1 UDP-4-amino-4,6-dideoxy-N-acetyl-beta-L-altrosamine transaminase [Hymenobacter busanensis]QHJ06776.1 UDP-4-amino-4,6-dideoxy-N-acetyl-beta-L-altrosamine transaminase [Hymenobacter busanensis]
MFLSPPIPYGRQHITEADEQAVLATLRSDFLTQGPQVAEFERQFAEYIGVRYAVAASNGTAALHLCTLALNVQAGQRVITTPITFAASANCVRYCGGEVHFADIDPSTALIDLKAVRRLLESHPRGHFHGLIPVDFAGLPVNLEEARQLADEFGLWIIEDACHAPGGSFVDSHGQEQRCGNGQLADLAIFSFHPVKHIATGEGGMVTTNRRDLYERLLLLRTHGITKDPAHMHRPDQGGWYMEMQELGYNYRLPDMLCALGISQLQRADDGLARRRELARRYDEEFAAMPGVQLLQTSVGHAYHLYIVQVADRRGLYDFLRTKQIFAQVHYIPVHLMPYYQELGWKAGDFPHAEAYYEHCLSLPMFPTLTDAEQVYVIECVREFVSRG